MVSVSEGSTEDNLTSNS